MKKVSTQGFTLIELLVVIAVIGILSTIILASLSSARDRAQMASVISDLRNMAQAFEIYHLDNNTYPGDVTPGVLPLGMASYLPGGEWPTPAFPGAQYDWEFWGPGTATEAVQVSVRFCDDIGCNFPDDSWASSFTNGQNAAYYCISGQCRPWENDTAGAVAGYCFNC